MRIKPVFATLVVAVSLIGLSACSDDSSAKNFNDADVSFAQGMIPHHRQATEMAALADRRSADPAVLDLASEIIAAQQPEIDAMSGWLKSWDEEVPSESDEMDNMDHGSSSDMPGMMSSDDLASLEAATGSAFDTAFLTMMIEHHEGAIEMATTEESDGRYSHAVTLAKKIQKDQAAEIVTMESLLQR
ncbi:DUF305 domain-containing protein [Aeromicrobium sp. A1-2]|uniref:DUF305 domain-containing protein n=1 Tax=Aeromicrobium sp. A1-2 TaxID=2107713 RepID=UPI000E4949D8|nr:DUF305 domain-containing protein [Aeromicrobium sp. A1-2]AXT84224.1 DUF305 domain-containing protein [Aeromicrobium sp. A1-2]